MNVNRFSKLTKTIENKYPHPQMGVSELLQKFFLEYGSLNDADIKDVAEFCQTDEKNIREIVEHYEYFSEKCEKTISVCFGIPCYINGADEIFENLKNENKALNGDGKNVVTSSCFGYCHAAPVVLETKN
jgi:NADH:ubiquinone oxidoreductase subunit E